MATINYVWDQLNDSYLLESDENGLTTAVFTQETSDYGGVVSQVRSGTTTWYHLDALGSTRFLTDAIEATTDSYLFDASGIGITVDGGTLNHFRWLGKHGYYFDSEVLSYYVRARNYLALVARWTSKDPLIFTDGPNVYTYVANRFASLEDPSGTVCTVCQSARYFSETLNTLDILITTKAFSALADSALNTVPANYYNALGKFGFPAKMERAGPMFRSNSIPFTDPAGQKFEANGLKSWSYLFFVVFDICEDGAADCRVYLDETGTSLNRFKPGSTPGTIISTIDPFGSMNWGDITSGDDVRVATLRTVPPGSSCNKLLIYRDMPSFHAFLQSKPPGKEWGTQTVKQVITVRDESAGGAVRATVSHTVTIGVGPAGGEYSSP